MVSSILPPPRILSLSLKWDFRTVWDPPGDSHRSRTQFVSVREREVAQHTFKEFLNQHGIKHIVARVKHPRTNGKIERFYGEVERRIKKFRSVDEIVVWHNEIKPHSSLNYDEPYNAFWYRLPPERILGYVQGVVLCVNIIRDITM